MQFRFSDDRSLDVPWRWQDMIAQLGDESMRHVVEGVDPNNRSRGVTGCMIVQTNTYDHKRHFAKRQAEGEIALRNRRAQKQLQLQAQAQARRRATKQLQLQLQLQAQAQARHRRHHRRHHRQVPQPLPCRRQQPRRSRGKI